MDSFADIGGLVRLSELRLVIPLPGGTEYSLRYSLEETMVLRLELFLNESLLLVVFGSAGRYFELELFGEMISSRVLTVGSSQPFLLSRIFDRLSRSFSGCFLVSRVDPNKSFSSIFMKGLANFSAGEFLENRSSLNPPP